MSRILWSSPDGKANTRVVYALRSTTPETPPPDASCSLHVVDPDPGRRSRGGPAGGRARLSAQLAGVRELLPRRGRMPRLPRAPALAGGLSPAPICGGTQAWRTNRGLWLCGACRRQTSVTAQTLFGGHPNAAAPVVCGDLAAGLPKAGPLGAGDAASDGPAAPTRPPGRTCTSCAERWSARGRDLLGGLVEVDAGYVGGREESMGAGHQTEDKSPVVVAVEVREGAKREVAGRVRLSRVEPLAGPGLEAFIAEAVAPGASVRTDGWNAYQGLPGLGYRRLAIKRFSPTGKPASAPMPHVHRVLALLKRWLLGTPLQGSVAPHQLRLLPRRVQLPLQPPPLPPPGPALHRLSSGGGDRADPADHRRWRDRTPGHQAIHIQR